MATRANEMLPALTAVGDAGAALGMTAADMTNVSTALGRMRSSNKTTLEDLNILQDRGIDAVGALASAKGVSKSDAYSMISGGDIAGTEAVQIIQSYMEQMYSGAMEQQSKTFEGLSSTLEGWNQELQNAMGEGYNEGKKIGMSDQIDWLEGEAGQKMQEVYSEMGTLQSDLENMQQEMYRDIVNGMFSGDIASGMDEQIAAQVSRCTPGTWKPWRRLTAVLPQTRKRLRLVRSWARSWARRRPWPRANITIPKACPS